MPDTYANAPENIRLNLKERDEVVRRIIDMWDASLQQKGDGPSGWWQEIERMYRVESPDGANSFSVINDKLKRKKAEKSGISQFRLPQILHSRVNALNAQMATVITRQIRFASVTEGVPAEIARKKEALVHRLWQDGGFVSAIRESAIPATLLNTGVIRQYPEYGDGYGKRVGVCLEALHPSQVGFFPSGVDRAEWQLCAHRKYSRQRTIKDKMKSGAYFDVTGTFSTGNPSDKDDTGMYRHAKTCLAIQTTENDSKSVELIVGQVRIDLTALDKEGNRTGEEKWYRFVLAYDNKELLSLTPYGFSQPEYFFSRVMPDLTAGWGGMSVGRMLYAIQDSVDKMVSAFYEMAMRACAPPIIGPELASGEKYTELPFGSYVATDDPVQPWSPSVTSQLEPINVYITHAERWADQVARVSQNTMGSIQQRQTTATTDSIIAAGVQVGQEEYLANFTANFPEMAQLTEEIALSIYGDLADYYQGRIGTDGETPITPEEIAMECSWEPTGKNPNSTPMAKVQDAMQLIQIAQDPAYGFDKWLLGNVIAENSSLVGIQVQKSRQETDQLLQAMAQAEEEAIQQEHEMKMAELKVKAQLDEEKAHNDAQRQVVTDTAKGVVAAAGRPNPAGASSRSNGKAKK